jgi:glycosyltransferase involved in cell wall biosynthesis
VRPLRVCIDARRAGEGVAGGVEQIVIGLGEGLSSLHDGDEEYLFLTSPADPEWIAPYLSGACRVLVGERASSLPSWRARLQTIAPLRTAWEAVSPLIGPSTIPIATSDGTIERAGIDVIHFPSQNAFLTDVPSVYQPHDLQHRHLPQHFSRRTRLARDVTYRAFCEKADVVVLMTTWGQRDVVDAFQLPPEKVRVVPGASVLSAYPEPTTDDMQRTAIKYALPDAFAFYPAQTFPHKNHLALLDALALLRDEHGLAVPLVSSGMKNDHYAAIERRVGELRLADQVRFLGFVSPIELRALYRLARCLVFPSTFEGWGLPMVEAFEEGLPVACSDATSLPEVAGGAAVLFSPYDPRAIAGGVRQVWTDDALRARLVERGRARARELTWARSAAMFRSLYREIGGRSGRGRSRAGNNGGTAREAALS